MDEEMLEVARLYKFYSEVTGLTYYLFSSLPPNDERLRSVYVYSDCGDDDYELFVKTWKEGEIAEITSLDQVPLSDYRICPFGTDEKVENLNDFFFLDYDIELFFKEKS